MQLNAFQLIKNRDRQDNAESNCIPERKPWYSCRSGTSATWEVFSLRKVIPLVSVSLCQVVIVIVVSRTANARCFNGRFSCCSKVYACDRCVIPGRRLGLANALALPFHAIYCCAERSPTLTIRRCHDVENDHPVEHANRMIWYVRFT